MKLNDSAVNFVEALIGQCWEEMNCNCNKRIEFNNVAVWARDRIQQKARPEKVPLS
jgi:hypothetical protein